MLVTDRHDHSRRVQRDLNLIRLCQLASPHRDAAKEFRPIAIVSDVALDSLASVALLRANLTRSDRNGAPLICILRTDARQAVTQAHALGAYDIVSFGAPRDELVDKVLRAVSSSDDGSPDGSVERVRRSASDVGFLVADCFDAVEDGVRISPERVTEGSQIVLKAIGEAGIRAWLDVVWRYDDYTYQHVLIVAGLTASFARSLGFSRKDALRVTEAALVHDIGKAGVPHEILNKPGPLTDEEMTVMRGHVVIGYDVLAAQGGFPPQLMAVVRSHHEYLDGSGYPDSLAAAAIPDAVRLVTICDIYAALIERRPYRDSLPPPEALKIMQEMHGKLDPDIFTAFGRMIAANA